MTSGAIAGFLDVAFNFNTQALLDDNLVGEFTTILSVFTRSRIPESSQCRYFTAFNRILLWPAYVQS